MAYNLKDKMVIAISSRALFDLEKENQIFDENGLEAYYQYQLENENNLLHVGTAYRFVKNFLKINNAFDDKLIEVIILSRNNAATGLRILHSIDRYDLDIQRAGWTGGAPISRYLKAFKVDLFLSAHEEDVQEAINAGIAAGRILPYSVQGEEGSHEVRIAFDGDAVLFSEESEKIYQQEGLEAFLAHERANAKNPMSEGPFAKLLKVISNIQENFPREQSPIKTALITARNSTAQERVIRTLNAWDVRIDEAFYLGGVEKTEVVKAFGADIFFDDQDVHLEGTAKETPSAKVPYKQGS
ncbi:MAG: 5'-nucleotidase [Campylobacterota bacterium]|nr:5'-nucleotidase [Campylobacterota bacterium]